MLLYTLAAPTPLGDMGIVAGSGGVVAIHYPDTDPDLAWADLLRVCPGGRLAGAPNDHCRRAAAALERYFAGGPPGDVPLDLRGTPFQVRVWQAVARIPYGEVRTYGDIAAAVGSGPRAVGGAVGQNRVAILVPCHRVVAAGGLGGYGGRPDLKRLLLRREGIRFFDGSLRVE